ncbi:MAG: DEAD/DEAH box helicase family protein [candidate division WOR-3 bacterium]
MQLKNYQEIAVEELLEKTKKLLGLSGNKKLAFKAPTGSGKTITMAEFIKQLVDDREIRSELCFIWTAPRQLHLQSKEKLEKYYQETRALKCSFFEDLEDRKISQNEILFFNWESINRGDNIYIRDNEQEFNLSTVLARTKEEGRTIILIIDEAHHHATSEISQGLIEMIDPKVTIEVSATPILVNPDELVNVALEDVKAEGMIKKAVILNDGFKNILSGGKIKSELSEIKDSEQLVIEYSLLKRKQLVEAYTNLKRNINPLVLIQLPDRIGQLEDEVKNKIIAILRDQYRITTENGKLAIWLSGEHVNKENVEKPDSEVEVLIFKQAIALGWDCPRAQILALFRQWHSPIFSIQTVGRIMRMPEPDIGHYEQDILNYGYVYTNLDNIEVQEDIAKGYITAFTSKRRDDYKPINLVSCYSKRHREKTRLSPLFIEIFLREAQAYGLASRINLNSKKIGQRIITDWKAENIDELAGRYIVGDAEITISDFDLQRLFDYFVRNNLTPFYPEDRSVGRVKSAIYEFFKTELKMDDIEDWVDIVKISLSDDNVQHIINVLNTTKDEYQKEVVKRMPELVFVEEWNIPKSISYGGNYDIDEKKKSIMQPFYKSSESKPEKAFIEMLEKSNKIEWWFRNGDQDATYFAVPYKEDGIDKPFYVDFIVKFKNGSIGLFDTKTGFTRRLAGPKVEGLYQYITEQNRKGLKLWGGIVTNTDERTLKGRWIYYDGPEKDFDPNRFDNWRTLDL